MAQPPKSRPKSRPPKQKVKPAEQERWFGSVFQLFGLGKELWRDQDPDEYVRRLREGWE